MSSLPAAVSTVIPEAFNIADYLVARHVREARGSRIALITPDGPMSFSELDALVNRAGNALRASGLAPEQRVVLLMHDGSAFYAGFLGAIKIGAVPVPINTLLRQGDYQFILNDSRAVAAIVSEPPTARSSDCPSAALAETPHRLGRRVRRGSLLRSAGGRCERDARRRGHAQDEPAFPAVELRQHGSAKGTRAPQTTWSPSRGMRAACSR